ncbi:hypothetical protein BHE74_00009857 [Ensete ventricosum]|uniref:Uncharacterized protein n=1 Tax=Ensete ventricosum TaxID=4639 RepID=A0A445MJB5_ENSVE|nr:hypothetical protein BHE74_00009857 [Ensete ventricosum]RZR74345.1 hypothetical protein BHM03_00035691 [Ensete ventricosum]
MIFGTYLRCPSPPSPSLHRCRRHYAGRDNRCLSVVALPRGDHPYGLPRAAGPCVRPTTASPVGGLQPTVSASGCCPCRRSLVGCYLYGLALATPTGWPWQHPTAPLQRALATTGCPYSRPGCGWPHLQRAWSMASHPCRWHGYGWPPVLAAFTTKMQQERVERFYAIQFHHMQFKTNLSHRNLGSDTIVGKPQRDYHMRNINQNKNRFPT